MKVCVLGGCGFIGSHLVEALVARGDDVTVIDNLSTGSVNNLWAVKDKIKFHHMPFGYRGLNYSEYEVIFHLAANSSVPDSVASPLLEFINNVEPSVMLLESIRHSVKKPIIIFASSAAVYGNTDKAVVNEDDKTEPISPYGVSKLTIERYLSCYCHLYGLRGAALRLFSVYGPRQRKQIVWDFMEKLTKDSGQMEVIGDGTQVRDMVYVADVVQAFINVLDMSLTGEVYNVGSGCGLSTLAMAYEIAGAMACADVAIDYTGKVRPGDCQRWVADGPRLKFKPEVDFTSGIDKTVVWHSSLC